MPKNDGKPRYYIRVPMDYDGRPYDRGQVIVLGGFRNDEKLIRLGYVQELPTDTELFTCAECGAEFIGEPHRRGHGNLRHPRRELSIPEQEALADREDRRTLEEMPLNLEKTAASAR